MFIKPMIISLNCIVLVYSGPSLSGHSTKATRSYNAINLNSCYYQCVYFSLPSPKARGRNKAEAHGSQQGYLVKNAGSP